MPAGLLLVENRHVAPGKVIGRMRQTLDRPLPAGVLLASGEVECSPVRKDQNNRSSTKKIPASTILRRR